MSLSPARPRRPLTVAACALALANPIAPPGTPTSPVRQPLAPPSVVVLDVPGEVVVRRSAADTIEIQAQATVRGFTLGTTNARDRAPYATERLALGDTVLIRAVPRPPLRAVGLSWQSERIAHVVSVPASVTLLVRGAARAQVDGIAAPRCRSHIWIGSVRDGLRCVITTTR